MSREEKMPSLRLLFLVLFLAACSADAASTKDALAASEASVKFAHEVSHAVSSIKSEKLATSLTKITSLAGNISKFLGPIGIGLSFIFSLFSLFAPKHDELERVMYHLDQISSQLTEMDHKLDRMTATLLTEHQYDRLLKQRDKVRDVFLAFKSFSERPAKITREKFISSCKQPLAAIRWLSAELESSDTRSIAGVMRGSKNKQSLQHDCQFMVAMVSQAALMENACDAAQFEDPADLEISREEISGVSQKALNQISQMLGREMNRIDSQFMDWVKGEVDPLMGRGGFSHQEFADKMYDKAKRLVPWRDWFVSVYNGNTGGWDNHSHRWDQRLSYWTRNNAHRTLVMASASKDTSSEWHQRARHCVSDGWRDGGGGRDHSDWVAEALLKCMSGYQTSYVGVVRHFNGMRERYDGLSVAAPGIVFRDVAACFHDGGMTFYDAGDKDARKRCKAYSLIVTAP